MRARFGYDPRYDEHVTCAQCGRRWQLLDWGCALHHLTCGTVEIPAAEAARIVASAAAQGVTLRVDGGR